MDEKQLKRYLDIVRRMPNETVDAEDLKFFLSFTPKVDSQKLQGIIDKEGLPNAQDAQQLVLAAGQAAQSSDSYKASVLELAKSSEKGRLNDDIAAGIDLVLAGSDIARSVQQIRAGDRGLARAKKPVRPAVPVRDQMLANALRQSQVDTNEAARALAPAQAQIQDQYQNDIANAKTASTGQAGAFGSYAQLAANRRNRAAMGLAPLADDVRRGQQARQDSLLGMRMDETQRMFDNNAQFYPLDLQQYNLEQGAADALGSQGRSNLRKSIYGFSQQIPGIVSDYYTERKYRDLQNRAAAAYGPDTANTMVKAQQMVENGWEGLNTPPMVNDYLLERPSRPRA